MDMTATSRTPVEANHAPCDSPAGVRHAPVALLKQWHSDYLGMQRKA
jgi:hypothetical protein